MVPTKSGVTPTTDDSVLTIGQALRQSFTLQDQSDSPRLDVELLLCHVLDVSRTYLMTWPERSLTADQSQQFQALLDKRRQGHPIAHLLGYRDFWSLRLAVSPSTLIPRPDTERLVELALECLPKAESTAVLDLGTGTGAIALAIASERPLASAVGVDCVPDAVKLAEYNRQQLGLQNVVIQQGEWFSSLSQDARFNVIVSNPPYIEPDDPHLSQGDVRFEPLSALVPISTPESEQDGLEDIRQIAQASSRFIHPKGWLLVEHGFNQGQAVRDIFATFGWDNVRTETDLSGHERVTLGQWPH